MSDTIAVTAARMQHKSGPLLLHITKSLQLFSDQHDLPHQSGGILVGMELNDQRARAEFKRLRLTKTKKKAPFAKLAEISRHTIDRVERPINPSTGIDIGTATKWLKATSGESVGDFLTRLSGSVKKNSDQAKEVTHPGSPDGDTSDRTPQPSETPDHGSAAAQTRIALEVLNSIDRATLFEFLSALFGDAVAAFKRDAALRSRDAGTPRNSGGDPGVG